jgi:cytochrome P450
MTIAAERTVPLPSALGLDLGAPALRADPYPTWDWLRVNDPVHRTAHRSFLLARYEDCSAALRDRRLSSDMRNTTADAFTEESALLGPVTFRPSLFYDVPDGALARPFIFTDPPAHDRLRRAAMPAFRPLALRNLASRIDELATSLVDASVSRDRFDAVADIALDRKSVV